jgi:hypothetical protein
MCLYIELLCSFDSFEMEKNAYNFYSLFSSFQGFWNVIVPLFLKDKERLEAQNIGRIEIFTGYS